MQEESHLFQGLKRDNHQIRQKSEFLWDAHNIRITNRDDSTLFSITNERGPLRTNISLMDCYVGHCVLGKYLVVFTAAETFNNIENKEGSTRCSIYRIEQTDTGFDSKLLFQEENWDKGWNPNYPIEAIGIYETELVQKVYWVDGVNQARVINISKRELKEDPDYKYLPDEFDFVQKLQLKETVKVTKNVGSGIFSPGTIQYAFTYYNKYSQETNIFYTTPIQYISYKDRGGSPEDRVANSFTIEVKGVDTRFDYMRVYSIHRTSIDEVPTVLKLNDISLTDIEDNTVIFTDFGNSGSVEDPTRLLYIGGRDIVPQCITHKDGTLFLGNIKLIESDSNALKVLNRTKDTFNEHFIKGNVPIYTRELTYPKASYYMSDTSLLNEGYNAGFKAHETYRLGIQAQLDNGTWTRPVHLMDTELCTEYPSDGRKLEGTGNYANIVVQYGSKLRIDNSIVSDLIKAGAKKLRLCVVFPATYERDIICQGIINPTVYNGYFRSRNSPFVQASWFFRPTLPKDYDPSMERALGGSIEYRNNHNTFMGLYGKEIQSIEKSTTIDEIKNPLEDNTEFFVDENIVTLNSPDIEFDTNLQQLDMSNVSLRVLGYAELHSIYGDANILTSSATAGEDSIGFNHTTVGFNGALEGKYRNNGGMVSQYMYEDTPIKLKGGGYEDKDLYTPTNTVWKFQVCPWHRGTSLNNDAARPEGKGARTALLDTKVISNLKVFNPYIAIESFRAFDGKPVDNIFNISTPQIFNSDELSILKIEIDYLKEGGEVSGMNIQGIYQGNVDTLLAPGKEYNIYSTSGNSGSKSWGTTKDPIRMKYKSSPHIVFRFESDSEQTQVLIPRHVNTKQATNTKYPSWIVSGNPYDNLSDEELFETLPNYMGELDFVGITVIPAGDKDENDKTKRPLEDLITRTIWARQGNDVCIGKVDSAGKLVKFTIAGDLAIFKLTRSTYIVDETYVANIKGRLQEDYDYGRTFEDGETGETIIPLKHDIYIKVDLTSYTYTILGKENSGSSASPEDTDGGIQVACDRAVFGELGSTPKPYLLIGELVNNVSEDIKFGGTSEVALQRNLWLPASDPIMLEGDSDTEEDESTHERLKTLICKYGDTWYNRYDCLKTYPYTKEDQNQVVEIGSFMCETRVNINGRYDRNKGNLSNIHATPENFNLMNEVYSQKDSVFTYRIFDKDYYKNNKFKHQVIWSTEQPAGNEIDNWSNVTLASTLDMDGSKGQITKLAVFNDTLLCLQEQALSQILFNSRVQIPVSDGVPIEISNGYKVEGTRIISEVGCQNKWSVCNSPKGLYFIDDYTDTLWLYGEQLTNVSESLGMKWWFQANHSDSPWKPINSSSIRTFYDNRYGDVYFTPADDKDALCFSEQLGQFVSQYSYGGTQAMLPFNSTFISLRSGASRTLLWENFKGPYNTFFNNTKDWDLSFISNDNANYTKIFDTIELRTDVLNGNLPVSNKCPINFIQVSNEYQDTGLVTDKLDMKKKFRIWRGLIPRHEGTRQRIRNPWANITIGWKHELDDIKTNRAIIHDISVKYTL